MDIELPHHIVQLRREKVRRHLTVWSTDQSYRWWARLWKTPHGYRRSIQLARALQRGFMKNGRLVRAPGLASGWFMTRDMPPVAPQTFREWWQGGRRESGNPVL
jgi:L-lactate dehydrogenase complex protein LldF